MKINMESYILKMAMIEKQDLSMHTTYKRLNTTEHFNDTFYINFSSVHPQLTCVFETFLDELISTIFFQTLVFFTYSVVFIVALVGNGLVCFVVHTTPRMKTVTNYFIVNLAVGDILMTLFCVPFSFVPVLVLSYWPFGNVMCKLVNYSQTVSVLVSAYTLLAISLDRYMAIMHPLKPRLGKFCAKLVVAAVWVGALATASPIAIVSQLQKPSPWHEACQVDICGEVWATKQQSELYTSTLLVLQFALPLSALIGTYARIAIAVWGGRPPGEAQTDRDSRMQQSKRKMIKMMVTVVAVFTASWLPLNIFIMQYTIHSNDDEWNRWPGMPFVWFVSHWLAMSHSCYNPIIYCYMNGRYRRGFKQVLRGWLCCVTKDFTRSGRRSTFCEGVPMSEMIAINAAKSSRWCKCRRNLSRGDLSNVDKCLNCSGPSLLNEARLATVGRGPSFRGPPVRAHSVSSHFF